MTTWKRKPTRVSISPIPEQRLDAPGEPGTTSELRYGQKGLIRILRLPQVLDVTGLGKTKIYELQARGSFPMRVQITDYSVGWIEEEVQAWLAKRIAISASRLPATKSL
jgi:prophage regulatory protein